MRCFIFGHKGSFKKWKLRTLHRFVPETTVCWTESFIAAVRVCNRCGCDYWGEEK